MPNYEKMYFHLFNALTDILSSLEKNDIRSAREQIIQAQQDTEEWYIDED